MRVSKIRKLIKLVEESDIGELEVGGWGQKVRITKKLKIPPEAGPKQTNNPTSDQSVTTIAVESKSESTAKTQTVPTESPKIKEETDHLVPIKSPMVGTFYRAPAPDAKPYVELNQQIAVGQVVCIIEAMKLMNEIECEVAGRVAKILVENAKPVEFGQTLFLIDPA
jgi:acetyl-CoA carboxylase biotin carboxyl carrier protein